MRSTPLLPLVLLLLLNLGRAISNHAVVPSSLGGIDMSELEVEMSAGCDPSVAGCEVVEPLVSIELRALDPTTHLPPRPMGGTKATEADALADSFHVWLALPQDSFWVNLAPTESHRVIDLELGRTEVGKVMLDADLALKRTAATLLHPDHVVGAAFWDELYRWVGARPARLCHSFRQWIVPGVATMQITPRQSGAGCGEGDGEDGGGAGCGDGSCRPGALHVLRAPLKVMQEASYASDGAFGFLAADASGAAKAMCAGADENARVKADELFERLVLPALQAEVNESPEYERLRSAYLWRVVGEAYLSGAVSDADVEGDVDTDAEERKRRVDAEVLADFARRVDRSRFARKAGDGWSPSKVFELYAESASRGEFHVTRDVENTTSGDVLRRTYFHGGIDWRAVPSCVRRRAAGTGGFEERCVAGGGVAGGGVAGDGFASVSFVTGSSEVVSMRGRR